MPRLAGGAYSAPDVKYDFGCVAQICDILLFQLTGEFLILNYRIHLAVAKPTRDIQVRGADARPTSVCDCGLSVNHCAVPLEYPNSSFEQRSIAGTRKRSQQRNVSCIWYQ